MAANRNEQDMTRCGVVLVSAPSQAEAEAIASALVEEKLAACVALTPIQSTYIWQGQIHQDREWQLTIKTHLDCFSALSARIRELHSYEVPEIVALPIVAGSQAYLDWIEATVGQAGGGVKKE